MQDSESKWDRFIIRDQFFKLYFENLSLSDVINIERLTDIYDLNRSLSNNQFHFAIIRYTLNPEISSGFSNYDQIRRQKTHINNLKDNDIFLSYPRESEKYDDSINFLSLVFSGIANINEKHSKIFIKDEENKNFLKNLLNEFKCKKDENDDELDYKDEIDRQDINLKNNNELRNLHNEFIKKTLGGHIENIPPLKKDKSSHFSLFFFKDSILFEFTSHDFMIREVKKSITNSSIRPLILEEILKTGQENLINYKHDITIFSESYDQVNQEVNLNSEGTLIIVLISVIFIVSFFQTNPQKFLYDYSLTTKDFFELDHQTGYNYVENFDKLDQVINYFSDIILPLLFSNNTYYQGISTRLTAGIFMLNIEYLLNGTVLSSNSTLNSNQIKFNPMKYYPFNTNILCGLLISFKRIVGSSNGFYFKRNGNFDFYKPQYIQDNSDYSIFSFDDSTNPIIGGSYNHYIKPYLKTNKINYQKDLIKGIKDKSVNFFSFTTILYNSNIDTAQVYSLSFELTSMSNLEINRFQQNFTPFITENKLKLIQILILNVIYVLGFIYVVFIVARTFSHHIIDLIKSRNYSFEWHDWVDLFVLIMSFISQILFYKIYIFSKDSFPIQMGDPQIFSIWLNYAKDTKNYNRFAGLAIFLISIRLIKILYTSFPNFGIVFQTLSLASGEIMAYIFLLLSLIFGITMTAYLNFAWYSEFFRFLEDTAMNIYMMLTGNFDYKSISNDNINSLITPYFYVFFMFFYNLILINVFLLTIRNNYAEVKEKDQKFNEAFAMIIAEKSIEYKKKIINLLTCGDPIIEQEISNKDQIGDNFKQIIIKKEQEEEENQKKKEIARMMSKIPFWTKIKLNFEKLNIKQLLFGGNVWTREEFENNRKRKYKEIDQISLILSIEDLEVDYEKEFDQLSDTILYISYIILFLTVVFIQLQMSISSNLDRANRDLFSNQIAPFSSITRYPETNNVFQRFFKTVYGINNTNLRDKNMKLDPFIFKGYIFLQPPYFRITSRILDFVISYDSYESDKFPFTLKTNFAELDMYSCGSDIESKKVVIAPNKTNFLYIPPGLSGKDATPSKCGGYVYLVNRTNPFAYNNSDYNLDTYLDTFFRDSIGLIVLDFVLTNTHYKALVYVRITIGRSSVGFINYDNIIVTIPINLYSHLDDLTRLALEIIYLSFFIYYSYILIGTIINYLKKFLKNDFEKDPEKEKFRNSGYLNQFLRIDFKSRGNDTLFTALLYFLWKFIERFLSFSFFLINSLISYLEEGIYNVIELITFIMTIAAIVMWITIVKRTYQINLKFNDTDFPEINNSIKQKSYLISDVEELYIYLKSYTFILSISIFFYTLKTIRFFRFSKSIYNIVKIIDMAKNTIVFHLIFIFIIYIGFAIWGFALFGHQLYDFSTFSNTIVELWIILGGDANYSEYVKVDSIWASIFIIIYIFLNTLILFNILNAIVIEIYKEVKHIQEQNMAENVEKNFVENVVIIISNKYNIFIHTTNEYYEVLEKVYNEFILNYFQQLEEGLNYNEEVYKLFNKEISSSDNYITVMKSFMKLINQKINIIEKIALRILPESCYNQVFEADEENRLQNEFKKQELNPNKTKFNITKYEEISVWVKMFAYIIYNIRNEQIEYNVEKNWDPKHNLLKIEDITIFLDEKITLKEKKKEKQKKKNTKIEQTKEKNKNEKESLENNFSKYDYELKKMYEDFSEKRLNAGILKNKLLTKEKRLRMNKKARNSISYFNSHSYYYHFLIPKKNALYNVDFVFNCEKHQNLPKYDFSCEKCYDNFFYFYNTYIVVYDLLVKYFYLPENLKLQEKEIYLGFYLSKIFEKNPNHLEKFSNKTINEYKFKQIIREIEALFKFENINNNINTLREIETLATQSEEDEKVNLNKNKDKEIDEFLMLNSYHKLRILYKKFVVWNCIYIILLKKYPYFIKEIKENSISNSIILKSKQENGKENYFLEYFKKIFEIDQPNNEINQIDIGHIKQILKSYLAKTQINLEGVDLSLKSFYEKDDLFMIDDEKINNIDNNIPYEEYILPKIKYKSQDIDILIHIWNKWKQKDNKNDQFYIFFGYTKMFEHAKKIEYFENFLVGDLFNYKNTDWRIHHFFNDKHRAELLKLLPFSEVFVKDFIKKIKEFRDKNDIVDAGQINSVNSFEDVLNYISNMKVNYMKYYDLIGTLFDKHFKSVRNLIKNVDEKYKKIFNIIKFRANNNLNNIYLFIDFFKLFISKEKFTRLSILFESKGKKNFENSFNDEILEQDEIKPDILIENIDNQIRIKNMVELGNFDQENAYKISHNTLSNSQSYESIILAFSLDPFQLIDVIRNIEDDNLKEFYMLLMVYIFDDMDFTQLTNYLERKTQYTILHKYKYFSRLLGEKESVSKMKEKYEKEKNVFSYIYNYSQFMTDKANKIVEMRDKALKKLKNDTEDQLRKLNDKED